MLMGMSSLAQAASDKYAPLRAALMARQKAAVAESEDAEFQISEYQKILKDPDVSVEEKPILRKTLIQEQARHRRSHAEALRMQSALKQLRRLPKTAVALPDLKKAYEGLDKLGAKGREAWNDVIKNRDASVENLRYEYQDALAEAEGYLADLQTVTRVNELLLNASNPHRTESNNSEFRVSLKLPSIQAVTDRAFGIPRKVKDESHQAQATLVALIGYSQFYWDYYEGVREALGDEGAPNDVVRNVFGVANGKVLTSDAIRKNESSQYILSKQAREKFESRLRGVWGKGVSVRITSWDQNRAKAFHRACRALSTMSDDVLVPNESAFEILREVDRMIAEKEEAELAIATLHADYKQQIKDARDVSKQGALSSAYYNATIWADEASRLITQYEAASKLLNRELAACGEGDWEPNTKGIGIAAQVVSKGTKRYALVRGVKVDLAALLQ